ncbi:SAM-dependent methyltransferase [Saccharothrix xinjiangensis]|uniref:SAM-dependent methyltransferase n=1 Tax=Saccharothrix xinjiangensis TaxID=204798 RepID=A0ABV9Y017_9PSEU
MNTTHRILTTLAHAGEHGLTGADLRERTGIGVRAGYPRLVRLGIAGLVTLRWESTRPGAPRSCRYRVTDLGRAEARQRELLPPARSTPGVTVPWARDARAGQVGDGAAPPEAFGARWPHPVLLRNHLLGGSLNRPVDRQEAARLRRLDPGIDTRARALETHRGAVLRALADNGSAEQVLDLSTGVPAPGIVRCAHLALADQDPPTPVVYVVTDDQLALATRTVLHGCSHTGAVVADPCDAHTLWRAVTRLDRTPRRLLHPGRPVVLDASTIGDLVPDPRRLHAVLRAWRSTVPDGSVLLLAHSLDPALPDPLPVAHRAGWHRLPAVPPSSPDTRGVVDHRTQVAVLTTAKRRRTRREA